MTVDDLKYETTITWLDDAYNYTYLREGLCILARRVLKPADPDSGKLVAYSNQWPGPNGTWIRRLLYVRRHDRDLDPNGPYVDGYPFEAVDPRTVLAGVPGTPSRRCVATVL